MDYEKKYKEALSTARKLYNMRGDWTNLEIESIFPELRENEDERIRKALMQNLKERFGIKGNMGEGLDMPGVLAWLEKQGKNNTGISESTKQKLEDNLNKALEKETQESWNEFFDKKNPINKVEPKFKVGDFIVNDYCMGKVVELTDDAYLLDSGQGIPFSCEHNTHLWTIKDAKAGDVLCCKSGWTCIFKALDNHTNTFSSYCFMDKDKWFCNTGSECHTLDKAFIKAYNGEIHPATKEQRAILFQKMHEAGYMWDSESKKLLSLKAEPIDEQKPVEWSEEDERIYQSIIDILTKQGFQTQVNWFKFIKDRVLPQSQWKPSDEQIDALEDAIADAVSSIQKNMLNSLYQDLKKLKG